MTVYLGAAEVYALFLVFLYVLVIAMAFWSG